MIKKTYQKLIEKSRYVLLLDFLIVIPFLVLPLLINLPYRVNIFLSWEGAYRMYLGQIPFKDFGLPMGFGYWLIPTLFFHIFGPTFLSLIKAQVFINLLSVLALRGILYNLKIKPLTVSLIILLFCLTYVIFNFWPWYNHSVIVFELIALYFITLINKESGIKYFIKPILAAVFSFLVFFTKQDVGGICFLLCVLILLYHGWLVKSYKALLVYIGTFLLIACIAIIPFVPYDFGYWFNYGQPPHNSRVSLSLLMDVIFNHSLVEKIYIVIIIIVTAINVKRFQDLLKNPELVLTVIIAIVLIGQSIVTRVTSPLPTDHMNYFHTFALVGIAHFIFYRKWSVNPATTVSLFLLVLLTFSSGYWKYLSGFIQKNKDTEAPLAEASAPWELGKLKTTSNLLLPPETNRGIEKIMSLPFAKDKDLKVLNMSELTFLAHEMGYTPLTPNPLWYHLNIGIFDREVEAINNHIKAGYYDIILFESIPSLNNFYPYTSLDEAHNKYVHIETFLAPRQLEDSSIDVFIHPDLALKFGLKSVDDLTKEHP